MYRIQIFEIRPVTDVTGYLPAYSAGTGTGIE